MADLLWLASYPKSGNTWIRILLANYLAEGSGPVAINNLDGPPIASDRDLFDQWVGLPASALDAASIRRLRPEVYRRMAEELPGRAFVKIHDAWSRTAEGIALVPAEVTAGVLAIVRNPLDMVSSCGHHWGIGLAESAARLCDPGYVLADASNRLPDQLRQELGDWSGHVRSWVDASGLPIRVIRYEDLLRDPVRVFAEVLVFCGLAVDEARVRSAVAHSAFEVVKGQEQVAGFRERLSISRGAFFRQGRAGAWRQELSADLIGQIQEAHGETMARFGYSATAEPDPANPAATGAEHPGARL